jgi:hypothetical protein
MADKRIEKSQPGTESGAAETEASGRLGFVMGWVVLPGSVIAFLVGLGAHWGARHPDAWFVDAVKWVAERLFTG